MLTKENLIIVAIAAALYYQFVYKKESAAYMTPELKANYNDPNIRTRGIQ